MGRPSRFQLLSVPDPAQAEWRAGLLTLERVHEVHPPGTLTVKPRAGHIGAQITGIDLSEILDETVRREIWTTVLDHKVVFFRGQRFGHAEHVALARQIEDQPDEGIVWDAFTVATDTAEAYGQPSPALMARARRGWRNFGALHARIDPAGEDSTAEAGSA